MNRYVHLLIAFCVMGLAYSLPAFCAFGMVGAFRALLSTKDNFQECAMFPTNIPIPAGNHVAISTLSGWVANGT